MKNYKSIICVAAAVCLLGTAAFCGFRIYHHYAQAVSYTHLDVYKRQPREYAEMDTQAFKGELGTMRDVLGEIQSDMYKSMEKNKPAKNKEQER